MKKLFAILLAAVMMLALVACGGEKVDDPDTSKTASSAPSNESSTAAPDTSEEASDSASGEIKTTLFALAYDDSVWSNIEDNFTNDEDYCSVNLQIVDPEDSEDYLIDAEIEVYLDDPYDFREDLVYYGFNQYEYKVNNAYETVKIGGVDLLKYNDDDTLIYFNRIEGAGATVCIEFYGEDITDSRIEELLKGLTINLEDVGNVDGPWEWEGERFSTEDHSVTAGGFTVSSKFIPFEGHISTFDVFNHSIAAVGDRIYVLADGELRECHYDGTELVFLRQIELSEDDYEVITSTTDGTIWLSGSMNDILRMKDGAVVNTYEDINNLAVHPSGAWGVDYFVSNECNIVTFNGDNTFSATPIIFKEVNTIMNVNVDENNIYVCASAADDSGHKVFVYNKDGVLQTTLCDAEGEGLGSITFVTQTANGYIGFDGNMRDVILWSNDGTFIAEISDGDLFGTGYPWFCASTVLSDGSILTIMTDEREDKSATELIVFNVTGF